MHGSVSAADDCGAELGGVCWLDSGRLASGLDSGLDGGGADDDGVCCSVDGDGDCSAEEGGWDDGGAVLPGGSAGCNADGSPGSTGRTIGAVNDGCAENGGAADEKSAQPASRPPSATKATGTAVRRRVRADIAINGSGRS